MEKTNDKTTNKADNKAESKNDNTSRVGYISQKTQRLAGALYALTRPFPADEPLRRKLRHQALSLVSSVHTLAEGTPAQDTDVALPTLLNQLCSQLAVAKDGGLISAMNFSVLRDEITRFMAEINDIGAFPGPYLNDEYFTTEATPLISGASNSDKRNNTVASSSLTNEPVDGRADPPPANSGASDRPAKSKLSAKDKRRQKILDLFETKPEITVNDVTDVINGYSTKTIQRDLKALVKAGHLQKHGKRRWTSYTRA